MRKHRADLLLWALPIFNGYGFGGDLCNWPDASELRECGNGGGWL